MRFVVHEHHARQLHYDLRLEIGGVLKSWAIPKGPSMNPHDKRLAIMVEDHMLAYGDFEGIIPCGHPGAGPVVVWDKGTYAVASGIHPEAALNEGKLVLELFGKVLKGGFSLVKMKGRGENDWLLIKIKDRYSNSDWRLTSALTKEKAGALVEKVPPCSVM
jgi:bifunctional non-homologous end joining protein LigD